MKPESLKTQIFLDSGDPAETKEALEMLGWLDGQTTNPSLMVKNPELAARLEAGQKISQTEALDFYKLTINKLAELMPDGSLSIEVYADKNTTAEEMINEGRQFAAWTPNAYIKLPTTTEGLRAAEVLTAENIRVNLTLCFSQEQAAAVHAATRGAAKGSVYVSPFIGRLDDKGLNGMDLIENIVKMYNEADSHVLVLAASLRSLDHLLASFYLDAQIVTAPLKVLRMWQEKDLLMPPEDYEYSVGELERIEYQNLDLNKDWTEFNLQHELTEVGLQKFADDWNKLVSR